MPKVRQRRYSVDCDRLIKTEPEPFFSTCTSHAKELEKLFRQSKTVENEEDDNSDCILVGETVPSPLASTCEGLIKRENDPISADKPFIETVRNITLRSTLGYTLRFFFYTNISCFSRKMVGSIKLAHA